MQSLNKLQLNIWFLGFFFYPLTFFMFKLQSFDISFFKIFVIILIPFQLYTQLVSQKIFLNKYILILFFLVLLSLIINPFEIRIILNSISYFFVLVFAVMGLSILSKSESGLVLKLFKKVITIWFYLIFLGFVQLILSYFGFDLSWESIGEPSPENKGYFLGRFLIRPASLFGEPRRFSAHIILVSFLYFYICKIKVNKLLLLMFIFLGISTQSSTFILVTFFSLFIFFRISLFKMLLALVLLFISSTYIISTLKLLAPRLMLSQEFSIDLLNTPAYAEQAGDFSFFVYVIYSDLIQFLFGNGIGMSNSVIATFTDIFINTKSEFDLINSRWLFYTLLIDFGLIGLIYFTYLIKKHIPRDKSFLTLSLLSIVTSLFTGSFIFIFIILILNIINKNIEKKILNLLTQTKN